MIGGRGMGRGATSAAAAALFVAALVFGACAADDGRPCYPGDYRWCACEGVTGYEQCSPDGQGYGACDCSGRTPGEITADAGSDANPCDRDAGQVGFLCPCTTNDDCQSGLCHSYMQKGQFCTLSCSQGDMCPMPSDGCNLMGVCKAP